MYAALLCSILVVISMWSRSGSAEEWRTTGPQGGYIAEVYASPSSPSLLFAMTPAGLFRSINAGDSWSRAENGVAGTVGPLGASYAPSGDLIAFDPVDAQSAYLIDNGGTLYRTDDAGSHWIPTGFRLQDSEPQSLAIDPNSPDRLYLATTSGISRSIDGGATFELVVTGLAEGPVTAIAVDPTNSAHLLIGGPYVPGGPAFNYSLDGGDSWSGASSPCTELEVCGPAHDLRYAGDGRWVAVTEAFLLDSTDGGMSWQPPADFNAKGVSATGSSGVLVAGPFGVAFSPDWFETVTLDNAGLSLDGVTPLQTLSTQIFNDYPSPGPWFAGTFIAGLYRRDALGSPWAAVNEGLVATDIRALAIDPGNSLHVIAGAFTGGYSGEGGRSLYASNDGGSSWSAVAAPPLASYVRAIAYDLPSSSPTSTVYAVGFYAGSPGGTVRNSGIYKSTNGGVDWTVLDEGLPTSGDPPHGYIGGVRGLALDPRSCVAPPPSGSCLTGPLQVLYAAASGRYVDDDHSFRIIKSADAGAHWISSDMGLPATTYLPSGDYESIVTYRLLVDASDSNIVYATTWVEVSAGHASSPGIESGVFRSDDGGQHWSFRSNGLPRYAGSDNTALDALAVVADPNDPNTLWVGLTDGFGTSPGSIYRTDDGGAHWTSASDGLTLAAVRTIAIDPVDGTLYAGGDAIGGSRNSVFRSTDRGAHWSIMEGAPPTRMLNELVVNPADHRRVLAGTNGGVWQTTDRIFDDGFEF